MPYITTIDLEKFLGRTLQAKEAAQADVVIGTAGELIDRKSGRSWLGGPVTVTGEIQMATGGRIRLHHAPIASISSLAVRAVGIGTTSYPYVAGTSYELIDAQNGIVLVAAVDGSMVTTTYVTSQSVPSHIKFAAAMIAAGLLLFTTSQRQGIKSMSVPGDYTVTYTSSNEMPDEVMAIIGTRPVRFA